MDDLQEQPRIIITQRLRSQDWHAYIHPHLHSWGCGSSPQHAVGEVIAAHYSHLGFSAKVKDVPREELGAMVITHDMTRLTERVGPAPEIAVESPFVDYNTWIKGGMDERLLAPYIP